jgi:vitamin B12 transporter
MTGSSLRGTFRLIKTDLGLFNSNNFLPLPDPNARESLSQILGKLEWEQEIREGWNYRISGSFFKEHDKFTDDPEAGSFDGKDRSRFRPQTSTAEFQTNFRSGNWSTTTFGMEFKDRRVKTSSTSSGFNLGGLNRSIGNLGVYLQEQLRFLDRRLILIPGIRLDDHQTTGAQTTPAFSASYVVADTGTTLRAGYTEGFKSPSLNELFFPAGFGCPPFGNPKLGPEKSWELNAGLDQDLLEGVLTLGASAFHRKVRDLIEASPIPGNPLGCFRAENVGRARFDGVELETKIKLFAPFSFTLAYTYLDWDTETGKLIRRAHHRGSALAEYAQGSLSLSLTGHFVGGRDDFSPTTFRLTKNPGYVRFDLGGSYRIVGPPGWLRNLKLLGRIENLFDKTYEEALGFRAQPLNFTLGIRGEL